MKNGNLAFAKAFGKGFAIVTQCSLCLAVNVALYAYDAKRGWSYWRCEVCDFVFRDRASFLNCKDEAAHYALHENHNSPGYRAFLGPAVGAVFAITHAGARGLDYGCGPGPTLANMINESGRIVHLYDPIFFPTAPPGAPYEFLTCTEVAEHFYDPRLEFGRMFRLLARRAPLILMTAIRDSEQTAEEFLEWYYRRDITHVSFYSHRTLRTCAQIHDANIGFEGESIVVFTRS